MAGLSWYVNRLKLMSPAEIVSRTSRTLMNGLQRAGFFMVADPPAARFQRAPQWLWTDATLEPGPYIEAAAEVIAGHAPVFNVTPADGSGDLCWNRDPLTGILAPLDFGPTMDVRDPARVGDIKYLWEPNRHLQLVVLAQAFRLTGDRIYLDGLARYLDSWLEQCPYPKGPNWNSGLELAIRLINWAAVWQFAGGRDSPLFEGEPGQRRLERWLQSIYQHVHFVRGHYSRFSSANNHLLGEAAGVFIATCTWPYWDDFGRWQQRAKEILVSEVEIQVAPDGVGREQTTAYQQFVLEFLILSLLAGQANGIRFPPQYQDRMRSMAIFIASLMDVAGNVPMIGDADDGCVLRLSQEPDFCAYRSAISTCAALFGDPELARVAGAPDDKTRLLVGEGALDALGGTLGARSAPPRTAFPEGGYYILGANLRCPDEIRLLVDSGPLGYLSIAAHGHADALSMWLSVAGREILVDPGTYTYHGKPDWRAYFRGTRAHNTITIDSEDQSLQGGSFMWLQHAKVGCLEFSKGDEEDRFVGEHYGYQRLSDPVVHRREICRRGRVIEVTDKIDCRGHHSIEQWWHFGENCDVDVRGGLVTVHNDGARVQMMLDIEKGVAELFHGSENPVAGWISRRYHVKVPSSAVCVRGEIHGETALRTRIECL